MASFEQYQFKSFSDTETEDNDFGKGIVRMQASRAKSLGIKRNDLVKLTSRVDRRKRTVFAVCRMSPKLKADELAIDYDTKIDLLGDAQPRGSEVKVSRARIWNVSAFMRGHPDPLVRYAHRASFLAALVSGTVSFLLGLNWGQLIQLTKLAP